MSGFRRGVRIGVDVGRARVGVARCDPDGMLAVPVETVQRDDRSDVCAVPAAGVVAEAMVAVELANAVLEKFGGDSIGETRRNLDGYLAAIPAELRTTPASEAALIAHDERD